MSTLCWGWTYLVKREFLSAKKVREKAVLAFQLMGEIIGKLTEG